MKLYHHPFSSKARKATMTARLLGSPVELVLVDLTKGAHHQPDYLGVNPNAKVPALVDGDLFLWESQAIMIYLADKAPQATALWPADSRMRAEILKWMFWSASHWTTTIGGLLYEHVLKSAFFNAGPADPAKVEQHEKEFHRLAKIADDQLAKRPYFAGESLTLADVSLACAMMHHEGAKLPLQGFEHLARWFEKIQTLDAWKNTAG